MSSMLLCAVFISMFGILKSELYNSKNITGVFKSELYKSKNVTGVRTHNCTARPYSKHWTIESFPNPQTEGDIDYCGRGCQPSWICDPDHVIKHHEADKLDKTIDEIRQLQICNCSNCIKGTDFYSISIAIVPQVSLHENDTSFDIRKQAADFANHLRKKWQSSSCGSNVVVFLSGNENLIKASVGPAVRTFISELCIDEIDLEAIKRLVRGKPASALSYMVQRFREIFEHRQCFPPVTPPGPGGLPSEAIIAGAGVFLVLFGYGGYMIKQDLDKKARQAEDKRKKSSHSRRKRKPSLALLNARRKSQKNIEEGLKLKENDANINIIITNEDGLDIKTSDENNIDFR